MVASDVATTCTSKIAMNMPTHIMAKPVHIAAGTVSEGGSSVSATIPAFAQMSGASARRSGRPLNMGVTHGSPAALWIGKWRERKKAPILFEASLPPGLLVAILAMDDFRTA